MSRTARAVVLGALVPLLLVSCTAPDAAPHRPSPTAERAAPPQPSPTTAAPDASPASGPGGTGPTPPQPGTAVAAAVRDDGSPVDVAGRTVLWATAGAPGTTVRVAPDGNDAVVEGVPGTAGGAVELLLAAPPESVLALQDDGSLVVLAHDGAFVGGAARPTAPPGAGPVAVEPAGDGVARVTSAAGGVRLRLAGSALAGAGWGEREGGRSLAVEPTAWARAAGLAGELAVWTELVAAVPEAGTPVMRDQLTCHALGAPDKATWNLEPWRPDVGLLAVLAAGCNPG